MELTTLWFGLTAFFWTSYFVLEGFDFGVGMLARVLGRDEAERGVLLSTIGPFWDGNEVWLVVAGGTMFAAFPAWYAGFTSIYYVPLVAILAALIVRGVALEYRGKHDNPVWRRRCDLGVALGSLVPPLAWGVALAGAARGLPLDASGEYAGGVRELLSPYALLGGIALLGLCLAHGATFLRLRTTGDLRRRAEIARRRMGPPVVAVCGGFLAWTAISGGPGAWLAVVAGGCLMIGLLVRHDPLAFAGTTVAVGCTITAVLVSAYPALIPSTLDSGTGVTVTSAASSGYALSVLGWVALFFVPLVLGYQGWSYWVFRRRVAG
ncbi:cytochrome d ubiquinol oxidase subunit II [Actinopolymorpha sp. B17G11]|uniref:cytochrome d ubiquinol oxidase subunit II n=1 Tax=Actinopolymorpha sp. B17G11 TaxID=3160861 RepID=UPI0032E51BF7